MSFRSPRALLVGLSVLFLASAAAAQAPDAYVLKFGPGSAPAGSDVAYSITVGNGGDADAGTVTMTDNIPAGMTFVSLVNDPSFTCTTPLAGSGGTVTCSTPALVAGATASFTLTLNIPANTAGGTTFTNIATVATADDSSSEDDSSAAATTVQQNTADVGVSKSGPVAAAAGSNVTYTIAVSNGGPNDAQTVTMNDTLPGSMTFVSITPSSGCTTPAVGSGGTVTCSIATLTAGTTTTYTLVTNIPGGTAGGTSFQNTATVSTATADPNPENNSSTTQVTVSSADIGVTKSAPATAAAGAPFAYTITLSNGGPNDADTATFTDPLPAGVNFISIVVPSDGSCATPSFGFNGTVVCSVSPLLNGASAQFTVNVMSDPSLANGTTLTNTATASSTSPDTNSSNNNSTASTTISVNADVSVLKSGPASVPAGSNVTYTISVANAGPSTATSVSMTDVLPANTTFVSLTQSTGPVFNCTTGATVTCSVATLAPSQSATFQLVVKLSASAASGGSLTNTASVVSTTPDSDPTNNNSTTTANITTSADVAVTKSGPAGALAGTTITYTITANNAGPSDAQSVTLTDTLPAGMPVVTFGQTSGPLFTCGPASGATVTCTIATFGAGQSAVFSLVVSIPPATSTGTVITNSVTIASTTPDPNAANNTSTVTTTVSPAVADLAITKTGPTSPVPTGSPATFTINVTNNGPSPADNVVVTDTLPAGVTFTSATPSQGSCSGTSTVVCSLGTLANGASATISIVTQAGAPGTNTSNTATVTSSTADSNPANNSATTAAFTVAPFADVPTASPLALMLLALMLAVGGAIILRR